MAGGSQAVARRAKARRGPGTGVDHGPLTVIDLDRSSSSMAVRAGSRVINQVNESCARLAAFQGEGLWHAHPTTDEMFVVLEGELIIDVADGGTLVVRRHQAVTVPAGTIHRPRARRRTVTLCFKHMVAETVFYEESTPAPAPEQALRNGSRAGAGRKGGRH